MSASLRDVAGLAGVSIKTVSNVVNGYPHVRASTRDRVVAALEQLNYRPNVTARNLRKGRTGIVALAVPELDIPYFAELARCVIKAAAERSFTVLVDQTDGRLDREAVVLGGIRHQLIDGLIFSPIASGSAEFTARGDATPMVLLGERVPDDAGTGGALSVDHVAIDNVTAAYDATTHLAALGRERIAAIGVQESSNGATAHQRLRGYRRALEEADLTSDPALLGPAAWYHRTDGAHAMAVLLDSGARPDAVFCFSDLLALGAMRTALDRGLRVPEDVAIIGFDDADDGRYSTPTLSTIAPDKERIAAVAVELLAARIDGGPGAAPRDVHTPYSLLARESTLGRGG
ncbi:MAG: LacI family DNA-binding transcriptional regulator [Mycobacteriales bacterium]